MNEMTIGRAIGRDARLVPCVGREDALGMLGGQRDAIDVVEGQSDARPAPIPMFLALRAIRQALERTGN